MSLRLRGIALVLGLALLAPGCAVLPFQRHDDTDREDATEEQQNADVALHVANNNWSQIVVFAVRGSSRIRLGDVNTGGEADFVLPASLVTGGQAILILHPIGGPRDFSTGPILVNPGQQIELHIENTIAQTNWYVS